jgi:CTP-dependent riboflavin kinase
MSRRLIRFAVIALFALALTIVAMAADNPFVGTWKLNVAKSKNTSGTLPKSETWKIEDQVGGQRDTFDGVDTNGKPYHIKAAPKYNGKDTSVSGDPTSDVVALKRIDANTIQSVTKKGGKEVAKFQIVVSKDGKTLTLTEKGRDSKGHDYTNTTVYDRQ